MKFLRLGVATLLTALTVSSQAQPAPAASGAGMVRCAAGAASAANGSCSPRDHQHRMGHGPGRDQTLGWSLMSREERRLHMDKLRAMKDYETCRAYLGKHHEEMTARASKLGRPMPQEPRRDACAPLKS
jgi:hypothetical protein